MTEKPVHYATIVLSLGVPPVEHDVCLNVPALMAVEAELKVHATTLLPTNTGDFPFGLREAVVLLREGLRHNGHAGIDKMSNEALERFLAPMKPVDLVIAATKAIVAAFFPPEPKPEDPAAASARVNAEVAALSAPKAA